jgi:methionyl-tRNA formyltransferase
MTLRVVFMGTPDFAVPTLEAIAAAGHQVVAAYTRAPAASGRGLRSRPSPVHAAAERLGIPVETPTTLKGDEALAGFAAYQPDVAVVVAYGMLLPQAILDVPRHGCLNLHASLLPRWRGAAPIQRAVMAHDAETGIAVMRMEAGLDTGPVGLEERLAIGPDATAGEMHDALAAAGAPLMVQALAALERGELAFRPQAEEGVTYARKITNEEARIDWNRPAGEIHDQVRGLSPFPGAFFEADFGRGRERVKVLRTALAEGAGLPGTLLENGAIACGSGALRLVQVQRNGKAPVAAEDFWRGVRLQPGAALA